MADRIVITGGSGFLGTHLSHRLLHDGYEVVSLDRVPPAVDGVSFVKADLMKGVPFDDRLAGAYAFINLAGESIQGPWSDEHKRLIHDTRVRGTHDLVTLFARGDFRPQRFISASAVGYYGDKGEQEVGESAEQGETFLAAVAAEWEQEAARAREQRVPTTIVRNGHILGEAG